MVLSTVLLNFLNLTLHEEDFWIPAECHFFECPQLSILWLVEVDDFVTRYPMAVPGRHFTVCFVTKL